MKTVRNAVCTAAFAVVVFAHPWLGGTLGWASPPSLSSYDERHLTIESVEVRELEDTDTLGAIEAFSRPRPSSSPPSGIPELDAAEVVLDKIINMGRKIWTIIEANRPVVNVRTVSGNALPQGALSWEQLQGWQAPISKVYQIQYKNLFGVTVVDFSFRVLYTHGGNVRGNGRYLTHVSIVPRTLNVAWGYTFDAKVEIPGVVNVGTSRSPIAGMELLLRWTVDTVMKRSENTASFFVQGDGQFRNLTDGS